MRAFFEGTTMHRVLILGAGKIGALISGLLAESGSYKVQLGDVDGAAAGEGVRAHDNGNPRAVGLAATNAVALARPLSNPQVDRVIPSLLYYCNLGVAQAAR